MPCLLALLALGAPRLVIVLVVLGSDWLGSAYQTRLWPFLGFLFLPLTTLAYAWTVHHGGGPPSGTGWIPVGVALLVDLGLVRLSRRGGGRARERR